MSGDKLCTTWRQCFKKVNTNREEWKKNWII